MTTQTCIISWRVARRPRQPWVRRPRSIACSGGRSLTGNFRHLQTHASIFPKRHSAQLRISFTTQPSDAKNKSKNSKVPGQSLHLFSFWSPPPKWESDRPQLLSPLLEEAGRKLGAAASASPPAVCVRVHAHVFLAPARDRNCCSWPR